MDVFRHHRMVAAEHRTQAFYPLAAAGYAVFVKVVAEHVHAVRTGEVIAVVAIEIGGDGSVGGDRERTAAEVFAHVPAELKGNAVACRELQVRDTCFHRTGLPHGLGKALCIQFCKTSKGCLPLSGDPGRRAVCREKMRLIVLIERDQTGKPCPPPRVPGQRAMFGLAQLQPQSQSIPNPRQEEKNETPKQNLCRHSMTLWPKPYCSRVK